VAGDTRDVARTLLVAGSVSADTIHTLQGLASTLGGAGLYAALGAAAAGLRPVRLIGVVGDLAASGASGALDAGGVRHALHHVAGDGLAFAIDYDETWRARYSLDGATAEQALTYDLIRAWWQPPAGVHLCPTGVPAAQLDIARRLRVEFGSTLHLSATTFGNRIRSHRAVILDLWQLTDVWVCDIEELHLLSEQTDRRSALRWAIAHCGSRLVCVTDAQRGGYLIGDDTTVSLPAYPAATVDPTGAGESFAGAFAAGRIAGLSPHDCALLAAAVGSLTVEAFGCDRLQSVDRREMDERVSALLNATDRLTAVDCG
jgi:ribokinase